MIESFKHKGLKRLFEDDDRSKLASEMVEKAGLSSPLSTRRARSTTSNNRRLACIR